MSSENGHIELANRNHDVLEYLLQDVSLCTEWIATVAFYKSLHVVEAVFANDPNVRHTFKHEARLDTLKQYRKYTTIFKPFRAMWAASSVARYLSDKSQTGRPNTYTRFSDYMTPDRIKLDLLDYSLLVFENQAAQLLSDTGRQSLKRYVVSTSATAE